MAAVVMLVMMYMCIVVNGSITRLEMMDRDAPRIVSLHSVASESNIDALQMFTHRFATRPHRYITSHHIDGDGVA